MAPRPQIVVVSTMFAHPLPTPWAPPWHSRPLAAPASPPQLAYCLLVLLVAMSSHHELLSLHVCALALVHIHPKTMEDMGVTVVEVVLGPSVGNPQGPLSLLACTWLLCCVLSVLVSVVALAVMLLSG